MKDYRLPAPVAPGGEPACALHGDHWANHWMVGDCVMNLDNVPTFFRLLDPSAVVGDLWRVLTHRTKVTLEAAFVAYDIRTGRA